MNVGELTGYLGLEDKGWGEGLAGGLDKLSEFAGKAGKVIAAVGATGAVALGASLAGAMDIQDANAKLAGQLGLTEAESSRIGQVAGQLYAQGYGDSMGGVNDAIKEVIQNIDGMRDASAADLQSVSKEAMTTAQVMGVDIGEAANAAGQMIRTGLAANATEAFDVITKGAQITGKRGEDLLDTFNEYSTHFRDLGLSGTQALGLIQQALKGGARDTDQAADALKELDLRVKGMDSNAVPTLQKLGLNANAMSEAFSKGGKDGSDALAAILDRLRAVKDPAEKAQLAVGLMGTQSEDMAKALYAFNPSTAVAGLGQVQGATQRAGQAMSDTASNNIQTFMRQAQLAFIDLLGNKVLPAFTAFTGYLSSNFGPGLAFVVSVIQTQVIPAVQAMAQWITDNKGAIEVVGGIIAAIFVPGLIAMAVNATIAKAKVVEAWIAQKIEAISSVAAQSASIYLAIADWVMMAGAATVNAAKVVAGWVVVSAGAIAEGIAMSASVTATAAVWIAGWVLMGLQSLLQAARMAAAWLIAMGPVGWIIAAVIGLVALIIANWDTVSSWTQAAWSAVSGAVQAAVSWIVDFATGAFNGFLAFWSMIGSAIATAAQFVWGLVKAYIQANVIAVQAILNWFGSLPGLIGGWFRGAYDGAVSALGALLSWLGGLPGRILGALGNIGSWLLNAGSDLISGLWRGIQNMGSWLEGKILGFIKSFVPGPVLQFLGISSPSRLFADIGKWIPAGLAQGIDGAASMASDATGRLAATVAGGMANLGAGSLGTIGLSGNTGAYGGANSLAGSGAAPLVHIDQFNATPNQSPADLAREMSWLGKAGG